MVDLTNKLTRMSRRRFLESLAAIGLTSETVRHMTKEDLHGLTGDPTDEVPRVKALRVQNKEKWDKPPFPEKLEPREPEYYKVSYHEHVEIESAYDAAENLMDEIRKVDDSGLITAGVTLTTRGQHEQYAVQVNAITKIPPGLKNQYSKAGKAKKHDLAKSPNVELDELRGELPEQATGSIGEGRSNKHRREDIPIEFTESIEFEEGCDLGNEVCEWRDDFRYYEQEYRVDYNTWTGIPAGCSSEQFEWPSISDPVFTGGGTIGPRVYKPGEGLCYITTGHQFFESDDYPYSEEEPEDGIGRDMFQPENTFFGDEEPVGESIEVVYESNEDDNDWDTAIVKPKNNNFPSRKLAKQDSSGTFGELSTDRIGEDYLSDLGNLDRICQQGTRSGRCRNVIFRINKVRSPIRIELNRSYDEGGGNSGGPYFHHDGDDLLVVGVHRAGASRESWGGNEIHTSVGYWIGSVENRFNVEVR